MTTTVAIATNAGHSSTTSSILDIPLTHIRESKTNPRRQFDETELAELAANIRQHGVLQPVLVWPSPDAEPGTYELVAGARRFRASRIAGRETIPASVRKLTDTECLELQLIENLQRADVHELDEARGYATLMQMQPETYTVETLAVKIGRSEKYVYARLRLNPAKGRSAVVIDGAQAGTVMHICRDEKCPVHARETRYHPTPQERAARRKELLAERVEKLTRVPSSTPSARSCQPRFRVPTSKWLRSTEVAASETRDIRLHFHATKLLKLMSLYFSEARQHVLGQLLLPRPQLLATQRLEEPNRRGAASPVGPPRISKLDTEPFE